MMAAYRAMLAAAPKAPDGWIPVSERMPEWKSDYRYIPLNLLLNGRTVVQGGFDDGRFWLDGVRISNVTAWQPLPDAPKGCEVEAFKDFSITDWLFFATIILVWLYMAAKVYHWFGLLLLRRGWRWWNRKDEKALAMDSLYDAFGLDKLQPGESLIARTEGGLTIQIYRPKE
jgi:hypothetical protein